jgi:hypothetical protein
VNQAIVKLFDGVRVLEPWVVYLKPMHENPELSWFDTTGREVEEPTAARRPRLRSVRLSGIRRLFRVAANRLRPRRPVAVVACERSRSEPNAQESRQSTTGAADQVPQEPHDSHP